MKFKSQVFTQVSGSIGGITYSHNRGGLYTRARAIPTDPATARQTVLRNAMANLSARWRDVVTVAQRTEWNEYAEATPLLDPLGEPRNVGGLGMYIRGNVPRIQSGISEGIIDDGPAADGLPSLATISFTLTAPSTIALTFDDGAAWTGIDGTALMLFLSRSRPDSINFFKGPYQLAQFVEGDSITPPSSPAAGGSTFVHAVGDKIFGRAILVDEDARMSTAQFVSAIAV